MNHAYEMILDRNRSPANSGTLEQPTIHMEDSNPLCGDEIELFVYIESNEIHEMKFLSKGCSISRASTDLLCEYVTGKKIGEILGISNEEMIGLLGIEVSAMRLKCALLGLITLKKGIREWKKEHDIRNS